MVMNSSLVHHPQHGVSQGNRHTRHTGSRIETSASLRQLPVPLSLQACLQHVGPWTLGDLAFGLCAPAVLTAATPQSIEYLCIHWPMNVAPAFLNSHFPATADALDQGMPAMQTRSGGEAC